MNNYYYLRNKKFDDICYSTHSTSIFNINNKAYIIVVIKNVPIKRTYKSLHEDDHIHLIHYLKGLNIELE